MMRVEPVYFLLVDDLEENLVSLEALLRREGLVLLKARSGPEALELLLRHEIALALLDVQMPGMDGFELAELMRGNERTGRVPIIFLTAGHTDRQRRFRGYEAGAVDFLQKPVEPDVLRSKASVFFELYRQQQLLAFQRDELKIYAAALKESDRRKDEFLATLAHELRNPLAPISNGLHVLRMSPKEEVVEDVRNMMERQMTHLVRLIDDLLDVSRVSQGKIELRRSHVTVQDALRSALEASRSYIEASRHTLKMNVPAEPIWLNADITRLAQIISNLLNNAAKYTPEGGSIELSVRTENDQAVISVADNGLGIPQDMLPKVFELFTQVNRNLDRSQGGLGIGLALVRQLVKIHGGSIEAESDGADKGSTFTVRLPLAETDAEESGAEETRQQTQKADAAKALRILVVDDNVDSAKTTGWKLEMMGHQYTLAYDGLEALSVARGMKPDVILLDIGLPGMSGYDVCRALRRNPDFKNTILVAQTGWGQERDKQLASEAGFDYHLIKPVNFENLSEILSSFGCRLKAAHKAQ
jgi:signal transduction histidine kinase